MAITITKKTPGSAMSVGASTNSGRIQACAPNISLDQPGRLRVANVMALLGVSHATLYKGMKAGRYPLPDGHDGARPYWKTATIRAFLNA
ncbi:hypothetical protein NQS38_14960 [Ralstonia pseudosolanacearum]|uniref:helix-turn-helix transcriptional regulator n=1 Tax=Ralstonia pseudosolanacearum TaxID=1310165 RepID=UPI0013C2EE96|nr:hypothetical protein [Ralstonia pseudosolanacearum]UYR06189.1 hypothetical protein NQS38_14960 [Ralstonia pseudosolanacearum]